MGNPGHFSVEINTDKQERGQRSSATQTSQTRAGKPSRDEAHDHAYDQPGLDLQDQHDEFGKDEERHVHRYEDQPRCGRTMNWPTFEKFLNASV